MMIIVYDCTSTQPNATTLINGGGEYCVRLLQYLLTRIDTKTDRVILLFKKNSIGENGNIYIPTDSIEKFFYKNMKC